MPILIKNIKTLLQIDSENNLRDKVGGKDMAEIPSMNDAYLAIDGDKIVEFGSMNDFPGITDWTDLTVIDASDRFVLPAWCDSHTHLVFAGSRETEFVDRIKGLSYEEIARRGGGILNSAKRLHNTSEDELVEQALPRLEEIKNYGTGAVEIKSGYGLTVKNELKMLRTIKRLKDLTPLTIKATFLGAHAVPAEYKENPERYIELIINEMLPVVAEEELAEYIDVFCENGYYSKEQTERILEAGAQYGLKPKIHVNQFNILGGIESGVKYNALSVDHLEELADEDVEILKGSSTMPTLLPSCSFFLSIPYSNARKLIDAGLPVALATDFNPGSTPSGNMQFVQSLGCIKLKMTPEEVINATTLNTAYAMELNETHGSIAVGKKANVLITDKIPSLAYLPYTFGSELIETVIINGNIEKQGSDE